MSNPFTMPAFPPDLAETINAHRRLFAGWTMTAGATEDPPADGANPPAAGTNPPPAVEPPAKPADIDDAAWNALGDPGKKALVAERDKATSEKQRADALQKQIDDAKLTAEEKATKDLKEAQDKAATAELRALKYEVAAAKGLNLKFAARLTGSTRAELESDADDLKTLVGAGKTAAPRADRSAGAGGTDSGNATGSVAAGRDLYSDRHKKTTTTS